MRTSGQVLYITTTLNKTSAMEPNLGKIETLV